jgi:hypothetical protein
MSIREAIEKKPSLSIVIAILLVLIAGYFLFRSGGQSQAIPVSSYFTIDDGQTTFLESAERAAPFDHDGKPAYRVWMFSCDGGRTKFPGYLERYTPEAKQRFDWIFEKEKALQTHITPPPRSPADIEVKKPGPGNSWVNCANLVAAAMVTEVKCPDGHASQILQP